ncbi:nuclear ribonuclease Z-like [Zingiber officinale]|uniref:nuclear ribonuclease Z-like n=1 Tax=Zingiber officinale TaxID=94328 RepID=UPI001C4AD50F|nr:nuclear ribonuclease Z-like [Zingiber officinale]XP_042450236.1 nuclear ribonuclease Z-like [Zingiber officinale]XP_042450243.1 nuclear ribonuclease Z-like [Zingiber officinale]
MGSRRSKADSEASAEQSSLVPRKKPLVIEGYPVEGLSIGGQETCVIFPSLKLAFDIGRCPQRAISQEFLFITHGHMDHIGGLPMYVATRGLYSMKPPTIFVPVSIKEHVEKLFEVHRAIDQSELKHNLVALNVGEEFQLRNDLKVRAFKTYHVIPSQGYCIYSVKKKLKAEFCGLSGNEIKSLRLSGVEITDTITTPEIAFTGDTMSDFVVDPDNSDVLNARILVMESTFVNDSMSVQHARDYGHTHLFEIASYENRFQNKAILLIHFSARYYPEVSHCHF